MYFSVRSLSLANRESREQLATKYAKVLGGEENANTFIDLWIDVVETKRIWHYMWDLYLEDNLLVLRKLHEPFWSLHQSILKDYIALRLARLLDEPETRGYKNLSVFQIEYFFKGSDKQEAKRVLREIKTQGEFLKEHRNKFIAHKDLNFRDLESPSFTTGEVEDVLDSIVDALKFVEKKFKIDDDLGWHSHRHNPSTEFISILKSSLRDGFLEDVSSSSNEMR